MCWKVTGEGLNFWISMKILMPTAWPAISFETHNLRNVSPNLNNYKQQKWFVVLLLEPIKIDYKLI